ncbi:MAG: class I SAM-dependent methyltransferase [Candidatus Accumulibacter sp.]|jgi:SAM-dependent methyltransferase|nr:class I SAM-dependent methyltransferase [Accumulibacter sp.]
MELHTVLSPHIDLDFSRKYDRTHAERYFRKHREGLSRRLSNWRETSIARKALRLAGDPARVLDLPCGAGRFWPMLLERPGRVLFAADNSPDMLAVARESLPAGMAHRVRTFQTSAFAIDLADETVDCVFCMRLLHHIGDPKHRLALLREMRRVTRDTLVISLWVDGNYKARRRKRLEADARRESAEDGYQNRFVIDRPTAEAEFRQSGFEIASYVDFLPGYAMWRVYTLRKASQG